MVVTVKSMYYRYLENKNQYSWDPFIKVKLGYLYNLEKKIMGRKELHSLFIGEKQIGTKPNIGLGSEQKNK